MTSPHADNHNENTTIAGTIKGMVSSTIKTLSFPVHPAGWPFIAVFAFVTILLSLVSTFLGLVGLLLTVWCLYFFRNPIRSVPQREGLMVSPADGRVTSITKNVPLPVEIDQTSEGEESWTRVSIFLSVFNVHVNRVPMQGTVKQVIYHPGQFLNASLDKASDLNERSTTYVQIDKTKSYAFVQIAGLVARRIINDLSEKQAVETGQHMGLIRFGSRLDVYLPKGVNPLVALGQTAIGGETVLADFTSKEKDRKAADI